MNAVFEARIIDVDDGRMTYAVVSGTCEKWSDDHTTILPIPESRLDESEAALVISAVENWIQGHPVHHGDTDVKLWQTADGNWKGFVCPKLQ